ncbi:PTC1 Serine/threonine protein phosphatase [Burkholderiaceae bacterium]
MTVNFKICCKSDVGRMRSNNEDAVLVNEAFAVMVLADGMGGHQAGEVASHLATNHIGQNIRQWLAQCKEKTISKNLKRAISRFVNQASAIIFNQSYSNYEQRGMGTTVIVAVLHKTRMTIGHVGDSRAYLFREGHLVRLTKDHTMLQELLDGGVLESEVPKYTNFKNILTRAVGIEPCVEVEFTEYSVQLDDVLLICSDGLTDMLTDQSIENLLQQIYNPIEICNQLIVQANKSGGIDNTSVAVGIYKRQ